MKTLLWLTGIAVVTVASAWIWLWWVNEPLNEIVSVPRPSTESQVQYIKSKYTCRLVRALTTNQLDVYSSWAIVESNRRTLVLATVWLVVVIFRPLFLYRSTPTA